MDIVEIAAKHPELLSRILAKSTGGLGEILVADRLAQLGYLVRHTNNNARQSDLLVQSPEGRRFSVEVKCDRQKRPTWFVRPRPDPSISATWVLVSAPRAEDQLPDPDLAEMFVLTGAEAQAIWDGSDWNKKNPENGDIRRWQVPDTAKSAWHKLPD